MLETTRLGAQLAQQYFTCTVLAIPSGSFPKLITVRLPTIDGPANAARWFGNPQLSVGDSVICRRDPNDQDVLIIEGSGDQVSSVFETLINNSGGALAANDCVIVDASQDLSCTTTTTQGDANSPGILIVGGDDGDEVQIKRLGLVTVILDGNGSRGDYIRASGTAKKVNPVATLESGCFGQLVGGGVTDDAVRAVLFGLIGGGGGVKVVNLSGATANVGDVGYLDEAGEYRTTTTAEDNVEWVIVTAGGAAGATIQVKNRGNAAVNYTGSAPAQGDFLTTSTSVGLAQGRSTMHPAIFAVCLAAGSGGLVEVLLLTQTKFVPYLSSNNLYRCNSHSSSIWTGTINGTPTTTNVPVTTSTGNANVLPPSETTQLAKLLLYNITRSTFRLVTAYSGGNITTVASTDSWDNTDVLTIAHPTVADPLTERVVGFDLSQQPEIPILARSIYLNNLASDSGGANAVRQFHSIQAYSGSLLVNDTNAPATGVQIYQNTPVTLINRQFGKRETATGTGTKLTILKIIGYWIASP